MLSSCLGLFRLQKPADIAHPPPTQKERKGWEAQARKAKVRKIVENTHIPPARTTLKAKDFFRAGVYNLHNHDIWIQRRRTP